MTSRAAWRAKRRTNCSRAEAAARALGNRALSDGSGPLEESVAMDALEAPPHAASELSYASARAVRYVTTSWRL
jgi:hypothetical protein